MSDAREKEAGEPRVCPRCGAAPMLYTPNARRDPYSEVPIYEPAWQCTRCGHKEFIEPKLELDQDSR